MTMIELLGEKLCRCSVVGALCAYAYQTEGDKQANNNAPAGTMARLGRCCLAKDLHGRCFLPKPTRARPSTHKSRYRRSKSRK